MTQMGTPRGGSFAVICVGELLWDILRTGQRLLGGAPANVAYHLKRLGADVRLISRVGEDELGAAARLELERLGTVNLRGKQQPIEISVLRA